MNVNLRPSTLSAAAALLLPSSLFAQGPLTPPGAPAPTMKTLDQLEARTPISSAPFTISTSGSYYLTANLTVTTGNAITINADDVTLDLNGFAIASTASPASGNGITINTNRQDIAIRNGHLKGTTTLSGSTFTTGGFLDGITAISGSHNVRVSEVDVRGVASDGINLGGATVASLAVQFCQVRICAGSGITAGTVRDCGVEDAGIDGISASAVSNSFGKSVGTAAGNSGIDGAGVVENCLGVADVGSGLTAAISAINCSGTSVSGSGVNAVSAATNCKGFSTSGTGLIATNALNCVGQSTSGSGLTCTNATNCVGVSTSGSFGLQATGTASSCQGTRNSGTAISANIAIGCTLFGTGTITAPGGKFLGTP